jgi:type IV pilus assembly protein PilO
MAKFNEMSFGARFGIMVLVVAIVAAVYWYAFLNGEVQANQALKTRIADKNRENAQLREFEPKLQELNRQMAILQQQMEIQKKIVPDEKDADQFIRLLHDTAATSGIEIRRYTALPIANKEFYSEVPFSIDVDGPYYSVLNFFQRVSELERIINIDNLQMANTKNSNAAKVKNTYTYAQGETVVASCTATTFYSHEPEPPAPAGPVRPGQPPAAAAPVQPRPN